MIAGDDRVQTQIVADGGIRGQRRAGLHGAVLRLLPIPSRQVNLDQRRLHPHRCEASSGRRRAGRRVAFGARGGHRPHGCALRLRLRLRPAAGCVCVDTARGARRWRLLLRAGAPLALLLVRPVCAGRGIWRRRTLARHHRRPRRPRAEGLDDRGDRRHATSGAHVIDVLRRARHRHRLKCDAVAAVANVESGRRMELLNGRLDLAPRVPPVRPGVDGEHGCDRH
eukprot:714543-Prymnesium_polylepis.3